MNHESELYVVICKNINHNTGGYKTTSYFFYDFLPAFMFLKNEINKYIECNNLGLSCGKCKDVEQPCNLCDAGGKIRIPKKSHHDETCYSWYDEHRAALFLKSVKYNPDEKTKPFIVFETTS